MRKYTYSLLGLLCGAVFFSGTAVMANSGVLAKISSQIFFLNGEQTELFAYNIGGNNYTYFSNDELHDILIEAQSDPDQKKRNKLLKKLKRKKI